jgi:hypothetical protein
MVGLARLNFRKIIRIFKSGKLWEKCGDSFFVVLKSVSKNVFEMSFLTSDNKRIIN